MTISERVATLATLVAECEALDAQTAPVRRATLSRDDSLALGRRAVASREAVLSAGRALLAAAESAPASVTAADESAAASMLERIARLGLSL